MSTMQFIAALKLSLMSHISMKSFRAVSGVIFKGRLQLSLGESWIMASLPHIFTIAEEEPFMKVCLAQPQIPGYD